MNDLIEVLSRQLTEHEGNRLTVYDDATGREIKAGSKVIGNPTIGVGRLLTDGNGISEEESLHLLKNDLIWVAKKSSTYEFFDLLDPARQLVIMNMVFNMGSIDGWPKFRAALMVGDYQTAAAEMMLSKWAGDVGHRASVLVEQMKTGVVK